jgi:N-acetyl-gamma-glutamyl-phosphate reductase
VVDISADFRLRDPQEYAQWYGAEHPAPDLLSRAVYGLTELNREAVRSSRLVANPGCYPESALLALAPAVKEGVIGPDVIIDSKSGISGAGRALGLAYHFAEANESVSAYGLAGHRHLPEIVQELTAMWPRAEAPQPPQPKVTFTPHLVPMTRGILSTCYAPLLPGAVQSGEQARELYREFYKGEPFVRVVDSPPATKQVAGSNMCLVHPTVDPRTERLVVVSVIDNLVKGAAGQAIQNMNAMLGLNETAGLETPAVYP